jgi:hypothetical protein
MKYYLEVPEGVHKTFQIIRKSEALKDICRDGCNQNRH